jgi:hypothetical protein
MTVVRPNRLPDDKTGKPADETLNTVTTVEGEIREFVRKDVVSGRRMSPDNADLGAANLNFLIDRVAGTSIREIDHLIDELQSVRDYLRVEGDRVQREIAGYAQASQAAMASAKIIAESMGQWKGATRPTAPAAE